MSSEAQLRDDLLRAGDQIGQDHGDLERVMRAGRRRRATSLAARGLGVVASLAAAAGLGAALAPGPSPVVGSAEAEKVSIYLCDDRICPAITEQEYLALQARLLADPAIASVRLESAEEAHRRFHATFEGDPELAEQVGPEQLTTRIRIAVTSPQGVETVIARYGNQQGVEAAMPTPDAG